MVEPSESNSDERQRYRAAPESPDQLSAAAVDGQGRKIPGQIVDLSAGGIGLCFAQKLDPDLKVGDTIYLHLRSDQLQEPVVALAQVCRGSTFDWGHNYGFKFVDWMGLLSQIPPTLAPLFNQRSEWRVKLDPQHVVVSVEGPVTSPKKFGPVKGILRDVSPTGLSFRVKPEAEEMMSSSPLVHVSFALPGSAEVLAFWARVLHCETCDDGIWYGAIFDQEATARFARKQKKLVSILRQPTSEKDAEPS